MEKSTDIFSSYNVFHLKSELSRNGYLDIQDDDLFDFFDSLKILAKAR